MSGGYGSKGTIGTNVVTIPSYNWKIAVLVPAGSGSPVTASTQTRRHSRHRPPRAQQRRHPHHPLDHLHHHRELPPGQHRLVLLHRAQLHRPHHPPQRPRQRHQLTVRAASPAAHRSPLRRGGFLRTPSPPVGSSLAKTAPANPVKNYLRPLLVSFAAAALLALWLLLSAPTPTHSSPAPSAPASTASASDSSTHYTPDNTPAHQPSALTDALSPLPHTRRPRHRAGPPPRPPRSRRTLPPARRLLATLVRPRSHRRLRRHRRPAPGDERAQALTYALLELALTEPRPSPRTRPPSRQRRARRPPLLFPLRHLRPHRSRPRPRPPSPRPPRPRLRPRLARLHRCLRPPRPRPGPRLGPRPPARPSPHPRPRNRPLLPRPRKIPSPPSSSPCKPSPASRATGVSTSP